MPCCFVSVGFVCRGCCTPAPVQGLELRTCLLNERALGSFIFSGDQESNSQGLWPQLNKGADEWTLEEAKAHVGELWRLGL